MINGVACTEKEIQEQRAFVAKMLREAADRVERGERSNLDWEDSLITRMIRHPETGFPHRVIDGYELRVKIWDEAK